MASSLQTSAETYFVGKETMCFKSTVSVPEDGQKIDVPFGMVFRELGGRRQDWFLRVLRLTLCNTDLSLSLFSYDRLDDLDTDIILCNCKFLLIKPDTQEVVHTLTTGVRGSVVYRRHNEGVVEKILASYSQYCYDDDTLTVQIEADFFFLTTGTPLHDNMRSNLHTLYKTGTFTDAIIRCDCTEFKVHKTVLAAESPVIRAMFEANMKEARCGVIEVSGTTSAAMSDLITYLYTGTAPNLETLANELFGAANKYQIHRLLKMCEEELQGNVKDSNVVITLIQADLYGKTSLKKVCLDFISKNRSKVFQRNEWKQVLKDQFTSLYVEALEHCIRSE